VVYGLDALTLVLEAELLPAALLAILFGLWLLGRRRFPYTTGLVADGDGRIALYVQDRIWPALWHQVGAAAPTTRGRYGVVARISIFAN
jgi:hypothetical protein